MEPLISLSLRIVSVMSHLCENEAENLENGNVHLAQIPDIGKDISRTIWRIEVSASLVFCIFHALSFKLNLLFDQSFPLNQWYDCMKLMRECFSSHISHRPLIIPNEFWISAIKFSK